MKKLFLAAVVMLGFAACTNDVTEDVAVDVPETLTVSFEESSRVQLQNDKTVWSVGDLVSVFYRSDANQQWKFQGKTGDRAGTLKRVSTPQATEKLSKVVVVYPYNENYYINPETCNIQAFMPAEQTYLEDSYGIDGNIMISQSEYNQFSLKNVCGWLKIQLKGDGQVVQKITLKGNNGEQVAGELYIDSADATATLATEMGGAADDAVGGSLVFEDAILTEVTLNCPDGVTLGSEATAFYIALPPQEFSNGFNIKVTYADDTTMTKSTTNKTIIERNVIQPMDALYYDGNLPPVYELAYTTNDGKPLDPYTTEGFGSDFVENIYDATTGCGSLKFSGKITTIPEKAFITCTNLSSITLTNDIKYIRAEAFSNCSKLAVMDIPNSVITIGDKAFYNCGGMQEITIPSSVTTIGTSSFENCTGKVTINCQIGYASSSSYGKFYKAKFTEVIIGDRVTSIGKYAFSQCSKLSSVTISNSVTSLGDGAFSQCSSLTSVTIPDSITKIGAYAFYDCSSLTSATIPDSVTKIGEEAFYDCSSLTSVTIPDSVTTIEDETFYNCSSLTSITIPDSVTSIGGHAFRGCSSLETITIPDRVTSIGNYVFYYCSSLTSITIPDRVTSIGDSTFSGCSSLTSITIPNCITEIGGSAFSDCSSLTSITIPDSVTSIGNYAFYGCSSLTSITIPDRLTSIGDSTFSGCSSLTSITIPDSVTEIGKSAFSGCSSLTSITIPNSVTEIGKYAFSGCSSLANITIPNSITSIGDYTFNNCRCLTSVTIPDSVTSIGERAFYDCTNLASITIPNSVTSIGNYAFRYCSSLTSATIPDSVISIGGYAFADCSSLTTATIGSGVTSIGEAAFWICTSLESIYCKPTTPPTGGSSMFDSDASGRMIYVPRESVDAYKAAYRWSEYKSSFVAYDFEKGDVVEIIPETWKIYYTATEKVTPHYVDNFNVKYLFNKWDSVTGEGVMTFDGEVTSIGGSAFSGCSSLTSVTIPNSVTSIEPLAFSSCSSLASVYISDLSAWCKIGFSFAEANPLGCGAKLYLNNIEVTELTIPSDITKIKGYTFVNCSSLTSVTIPDSVTSIGDYAFSDCSSLTSITIPNSVTSIGNYAFYVCSSLTSITIPNSVTEIGKGAFECCNHLTEVYCKPTIPPTVYFGMMFDYNASDRKIYVPRESVDAYKAASYWSNYADDIVAYDFE